MSLWPSWWRDAGSIPAAALMEVFCIDCNILLEDNNRSEASMRRCVDCLRAADRGQQRYVAGGRYARVKVSMAEYEQRLNAQRGECGCCGGACIPDFLDVDRPGVLRGVLCRVCSGRLRYYRRSKARLAKKGLLNLVKYLGGDSQ